MKASDLRGILTYVPQFREGIFVVCIDSVVLTDENLPNLFLDISVLRSLNIKVVLVHGASVQIAMLGGEWGIELSNIDGKSLTDTKTMRLAELASGHNSQQILQGLSDNDLRGAVANALGVHPKGIISGIDQQHTGKVERVDVPFLEDLLAHNIIPVISPIGFDGDGNAFRVNANSAALEVARAIRAAKLIFLTTCNGVQREDKWITQMSVAEAEEYLKKNKTTIAPDIAAKLEYAIGACKGGVNRSHILNGLQDGVLIEEIFSNDGVGTMIYANEYTAVRRAMKKDVRAIMALVQESVTTEELAYRTRQDILRQLQHFYVFEIDRNIVGCVALEILQEEPKIAEMACLAVSNVHANQGIGRKLIHFTEEKAQEMGVRKLLALSTQAFNYLRKKGGFEEGNMETLPPERLKKYKQNGRNSKILFKKLSC